MSTIRHDPKTNNIFIALQALGIWSSLSPLTFLLNLHGGWGICCKGVKKVLSNTVKEKRWLRTLRHCPAIIAMKRLFQNHPGYIFQLLLCSHLSADSQAESTEAQEQGRMGGVTLDSEVNARLVIVPSLCPCARPAPPRALQNLLGPTKEISGGQ